MELKPLKRRKFTPETAKACLVAARGLVSVEDARAWVQTVSVSKDLQKRDVRRAVKVLREMLK